MGYVPSATLHLMWLEAQELTDEYFPKREGDNSPNTPFIRLSIATSSFYAERTEEDLTDEEIMALMKRFNSYFEQLKKRKKMREELK